MVILSVCGREVMKRGIKRQTKEAESAKQKDKKKVKAKQSGLEGAGFKGEEAHKTQTKTKAQAENVCTRARTCIRAPHTCLSMQGYMVGEQGNQMRRDREKEILEEKDTEAE